MATHIASNKIKYLLATKAIDFANDTFKIILMQSGFVFNRDTHHQYSDVSASQLSAGYGYTTGGATLTGVVVTEDDTNDRCSIVWNDATWTASGGDIGPSDGAIIYDDTDANDSIVGYIDFGADYTQADGGTATIIDPKVYIE